MFWARIIAGFFSAVFLVFIVVIIKKLSAFNRPVFKEKIVSNEGRLPKIIKGPWQDILKKLESESPSDWNLAVIQADSLVDSILKGMGLVGESMGDRMKTLDSSRLATIDDLWEAHRIRNQIVHDADRVISKHQATYVVSLFEKVIDELDYFGE